MIKIKPSHKICIFEKVFNLYPMKSLTLIGFIMLGLAAVLFYFNNSFTFIKLFEPIALMGIFAGVGIGLIIGGIVGYVSKGTAIKEEQKRKELKRMQKERTELEKQAEELRILKEQQQSDIVSDTTKNPQF